MFFQDEAFNTDIQTNLKLKIYDLIKNMTKNTVSKLVHLFSGEPPIRTPVPLPVNKGLALDMVGLVFKNSQIPNHHKRMISKRFKKENDYDTSLTHMIYRYIEENQHLVYISEGYAHLAIDYIPSSDDWHLLEVYCKMEKNKHGKIYITECYANCNHNELKVFCKSQSPGYGGLNLWRADLNRSRQKSSHAMFAAGLLIAFLRFIFMNYLGKDSVSHDHKDKLFEYVIKRVRECYDPMRNAFKFEKQNATIMNITDDGKLYKWLASGKWYRHGKMEEMLPEAWVVARGLPGDPITIFMMKDHESPDQEIDHVIENGFVFVGENDRVPLMSDIYIWGESPKRTVLFATKKVDNLP